MTTTRTIAAAFLQHAPLFGDVAGNLAVMEALLPEADLIVLPELAATGYDFVDRAEALALAEPFGEGPCAAACLRWAKERRCTVVMGYAERVGERAYNSALTAAPDGALTNYRKIHLYSRENDLFEPGDAPAPVIDTPAGRIGVMICFDWFFPETARSLALRGAQIIAHPSNLVMPYCQRAMFARSVENRVYMITANRIGAEERAGRRLVFTGGSQILSPTGETLASAPVDAVHTATAMIEPERADDKALNPYNDLIECRRPDLYAGL